MSSQRDLLFLCFSGSGDFCLTLSTTVKTSSHLYMYSPAHTRAQTLFDHSKTVTSPGLPYRLGWVKYCGRASGEWEQGASVFCPTARGRGQLEWDSGQLAQNRLQTQEAGDGFSSSLLACRFLISFCDLCTLEVSLSKHRLLSEEAAAL